MSTRFRDRRAAGRLLGEAVAGLGLPRPVVLALPRGGVPVAVEVAERLGEDGRGPVPVEVLVARKIGAPGQPELGVGAIAEGGDPVFDPRLLEALDLTVADVEQVVTGERAELERRVRTYRGGRPLPPLAAADVVVVDDGLATGGTALAALRAVRMAGPRRTVLAVPVAPLDTVRGLRLEADDVVVVHVPERFGSVGRWYERFPQLSDREVLALLARGETVGRGVVSPPAP